LPSLSSHALESGSPLFSTNWKKISEQAMFWLFLLARNRRNVSGVRWKSDELVILCSTTIGQPRGQTEIKVPTDHANVFPVITWSSSVSRDILGPRPGERRTCGKMSTGNDPAVQSCCQWHIEQL